MFEERRCLQNPLVVFSKVGCGVVIHARPHEGAGFAMVKTLIAARRTTQPERITYDMGKSAYPALFRPRRSSAQHEGSWIGQPVKVSAMQDGEASASGA